MPNLTSIKTRSNRENAKRSTGPRTEEGKHRASQNAVKHGLTSTHTVVLPTEDADAYQSHLATYQKMLKPETDQERELVQTLANTRWRLNRCGALEANLFALALEDQEPDPTADSGLAAARAFKNSADLFLKLSTYEQRLMRLYQTTKKELDTLQAARLKAVNAEMFQAKRVRNLFLENDIRFDPTEFGFVSTEAAIEQATLRELALNGGLTFTEIPDDAAPEALAS